MKTLVSRRLLWWVMTLMCLAFAPTAAEFYWVNAAQGTATYARLLAVSVSDAYAYGPESGFAIMTPYWQNMPEFNQIVLGIHAFLAAIVLSIGPFLFSAWVRRRWPSSHRRLGRAYVGLGLVSMLLSMVYLLLTPMDRIYGGAPFAIGLWGIAILTTYTLVAGTWHIVRGEIQEHRAIMVLNFSAMLIAPLLRLWWLVLGAVFDSDPSIMQAQTHVAVLMFLGLETMLGAILVMHVLRLHARPGRSSAAVRGFRIRTRDAIPRIHRWAAAIGGVAAVAVVNQSLIRFVGGVDLLAAVREPGFAAREEAHFAAAPHLWVIEALALASIYIFGPRVLRTLFEDGVLPRRTLAGAVFSVGAVCGTWLIQAATFGREGIAGWGSSVYWGTLAFAVFLFMMVFLHAVVKGAGFAVREFSLHVYALLCSPILLGVMQFGFLILGFDFEDAFLSGAVASTSLTLSTSYYYTVYGNRAASSARSERARQREPVGLILPAQRLDGV